MSDHTARTAHHEAGHAVAHVLRRVSFRYVTIRPRSRGLTLGRVALYGSGKVYLDDAAITLCMGPLAETIYRCITERAPMPVTGDDYLRAFYDAGGEHDVTELMVTLKTLGAEALAWILDRSWDLAMAHWDGIERVAEALMVRKTLASAEVRRLVHPAT